MPEPHTLKTTRIEPSASGKAVRKLLTDGHELWTGECSCERWRIPLGEQPVIRAQHAAHVQERLGPDGSERTQR